MSKKFLTITTGVYLGLFFFGLFIEDPTTVWITALGISLNALVAVVHSEEF